MNLSIGLSITSACVSGAPSGPPDGEVWGSVNAGLPVATLVAAAEHTPVSAVSSSVSEALPVATLVAAGAHVHPSNFGTLVAWIDPRSGVTHTGDGTPLTAWTGMLGHTGTMIASPTYEATGWNGSPSILFNGTDNGCAFDTVATPFTGSDVPFQIVGSFQVLANTTAKCLIGFGNSGSNLKFRKLETLSSDRYHFLVRDDAAAQKTDTSAVSDLVLTRTRLSWLFTGTAGSLYKNTVLTGIDGGTDLDVGTITLDRFSFGCARGASNVFFCNMRVGPILVYSTLTDRAGAEQWLSDQGYS